MKHTICILMALFGSCVSASSLAQTIYVTGITASGYSPVVEFVDGGQFELRVVMDTAGASVSAVEFVVTNPVLLVPGMFAAHRDEPNPRTYDVGLKDYGEYIMGFADCYTEMPWEILTMWFLRVGGYGPANDIVVSVGGLEPGNTQPSSFDGRPGFFDCDGNGIALRPDGPDGGVTGSGVVFPDGSVVLNPTPIAIDNEVASFGAIKAKFE